MRRQMMRRTLHLAKPTIIFFCLIDVRFQHGHHFERIMWPHFSYLHLYRLTSVAVCPCKLPRRSLSYHVSASHNAGALHRLLA
ncbi:hypothetical protein BCR43DRAFT_278024 [Syncephalastrum racemosum]|uniref:Uncharacterized protein n=1 Tax=Syncephalastrum racemosum TaxID=13706 RepID=A0A1X2HCG5_SYNRA|nr:hypothetical protein BCR43DRAFT_278024 [Syncephalastrum racemosum]